MSKHTNLHTDKGGMTWEATSHEADGETSINLNVMAEVGGGYRVIDQIAFAFEDAEAIIKLIQKAVEA